MLIPLLVLTAALAGDYPAYQDELNRHLDEALTAFQEHRYLAFAQAQAGMERDLDHLSDVLKGEPLERVHLVYTARAWLDGDEDALRAGFRGLRAVSPGFMLPAGWSEEGDRLERLYREAVGAGPGPEARLPGHLVVDGRMAEDRLPVERACVVQIRTPTGAWATWYVHPGEGTAAWLAARAVVEERPVEPAAPVPVPVDE
ncbi:MAG: hypothetical protein ABIO70_11580 [Pseudomonadota bacterium]